MTSRTAVAIAGFVVWATLIGLTFYELFTTGPSVLILISLVLVGVLGVGIFGALGQQRGGRR